MYDNLVRELQCCPGAEYGCSQCEYRFTLHCRETLMKHAADAIEELQKDLERSKEYEAFWQKEATEALKKFQVAVASNPRWIPVTERLPESMHEYVLCCGEKGGQFVGWVFKGMLVNGKASAFQHGGKGRYITHWQPLPGPPKEETE